MDLIYTCQQHCKVVSSPPACKWVTVVTHVVSNRAWNPLLSGSNAPTLSTMPCCLVFLLCFPNTVDLSQPVWAQGIYVKLLKPYLYPAEQSPENGQARSGGTIRRQLGKLLHRSGPWILHPWEWQKWWNVTCKIRLQAQFIPSLNLMSNSKPESPPKPCQDSWSSETGGKTNLYCSTQLCFG